MKWKNFLIAFGIEIATFCVCMIVDLLLDMKMLTPMIFILGVFLVSRYTEGYFYGIAASIASVLLVNYAFTFPYFAFDFAPTVSFISAVCMMTVTFITSTMTTQIKRQSQVKAENQREKMRANLLRAISHDLRTPLTSIRGACSILLEDGASLSDAQRRTLLAEMQENSDWLVRMVENLLTVTRISADGGVKINKSPVVLEELTESAISKFNKQHPEHPVRVDIPEEFILIPMDAILIEQVLVNLLENAVQHAKGMTELCFSAKVDGTEAIFAVEDDGAGIPEDRLPNLFSGYLGSERIPADNRKHNMGIGLSVCSTIIHAHGGTISAENRPEGGARFRFSLPLEEKKDEQ
ncbi:MAG TPA: DUF4118 domain-containing protein [Oscillospiraceae bacterium]|nr:DUF4118 domain-containing protein [Oscillospiraceae bacterium]HPV99677.1 DUF4118 domain-containing protein [Oscillospiraceae bacterium]